MASQKFDLDQLLRQGIPSFGDAWVDQVMDRLNKISPLTHSRKHPALTKADLAKLKYSYLVQIIKKEPARPELPIKTEGAVMKIGEIVNELLQEKLVVPVESKGQVGTEAFEVTDLGRRFIENFAQSSEKEK